MTRPTVPGIDRDVPNLPSRPTARPGTPTVGTTGPLRTLTPGAGASPLGPLTDRTTVERDGSALAPLVAGRARDAELALSSRAASPLVADPDVALALDDADQPLIAAASGAGDGDGDGGSEEPITLAFADGLLADGSGEVSPGGTPIDSRTAQNPAAAMATLGGLSLFLALKARREAVAAARRIAHGVKGPRHL